MLNVLKLEEAAMLALGAAVFATLGLSWWWFILLFFAPDLGMAGYLAGPKVGAFTYNLVHHKAVAIGLYGLGLVLASLPLTLAGVIIFSHSSFDRIFGFGLKYSDSFEHTHLGMIGRATKN